MLELEFYDDTELKNDIIEGIISANNNFIKEDS